MTEKGKRVFCIECRKEDRIESVTKDEAALKQIAIERRQIERKLYQQAPLKNE